MGARRPEATTQTLSAFSCPADFLGEPPLLTAHATRTGAAEKGALWWKENEEARPGRDGLGVGEPGPWAEVGRGGPPNGLAPPPPPCGPASWSTPSWPMAVPLAASRIHQRQELYGKIAEAFRLPAAEVPTGEPGTGVP